MDHSVQGYLQRMSTEKLEGALRTYLQGDQWKDNHYAIMMIIGQLRSRNISGEENARIMQLWEEYLRKLEQAEA